MENVKVFEIETDEGVVKIKQPDRNTLKLVLAKIGRDQIGAAEAIVANCWIDGPENLKNDNGFLIALVNILEDLIGVKTISLKKN